MDGCPVVEEREMGYFGRLLHVLVIVRHGTIGTEDERRKVKGD